MFCIECRSKFNFSFHCPDAQKITFFLRGGGERASIGFTGQKKYMYQRTYAVMAHSHTERWVRVLIPLPGDFPWIDLWLQLYYVESSHLTKTGTDTHPKLATVAISGTGHRPRERYLCM